MFLSVETGEMSAVATRQISAAESNKNGRLRIRTDVEVSECTCVTDERPRHPFCISLEL